MRIGLIAKVIALLTVCSAYGATYYVATATSTPPGSDTNAGTAGAPFLTISNALAHADPAGGDIIRVGDGLYEITEQLSVSVPVTIQSVNGRDKTEVRRVNVLTTTDTDVERCLYLNHPSAVVDGLTFSGGRIYHGSGSEIPDCMGAGVLIGTEGGTLQNAAITNCLIARSGVYGGGLAMAGSLGTVTNTAITDNRCGMRSASTIDGWTTYGAGVYMAGGLMVDCEIARNTDMSQNQHRGAGLFIKGGTVRRTRITDNVIYRAESESYGAGAYGSSSAIFENCLFARNRNNRGPGGGAYAGWAETFHNCTFADNVSLSSGGLHANRASIRLYNCLLQDNLTTSDATAGTPEWGGNASAVCSNSLSTVALTAPSLDCTVGRAFFSNADYNLSPMSSRTDVGWKPIAPGTTAADFDRTGYTCIAGTPTIFTASGVSSDATPLAYRWQVGSGEWSAYSTNSTFAATFATDGYHTVSMQAKTGLTELPVVTKTIYAGPATITVDGTSLESAIPLAADGTVIHVKAGIYPVAAQINLTNAVTLVADDGATVTEIRRTTTSKPTSLAADHPRPFLQRAVFINHPRAELRDFAVSGGWNFEDRTTYDLMNAGSGVLIGPKGGILSGAVVTNCGCASTIKCAAVGLLSRAALVTNCVIAQNTMKSWIVFGGGVLLAGGGRITHSVISNNVIDSNNQSHGGGIYSLGGYISHCHVTGNTTKRDYGGAGIHTTSGGTIVDNCLIGNNTSATKGGGIYGSAGTFVNCTIVGNTAQQGGGVFGTSANLKLHNCIIQGNAVTSDTSPGAPEWNGDKPLYTYSLCPRTLPTADAGNLTATAPFEAGSSYRIAAGSPGFDAGSTETFTEYVGTTDLDGSNRVWGAAIDMGCTEYCTSKAFSCSILPPEEIVLQGSTATFTASLVNPLAKELTLSWFVDDVLSGSDLSLTSTFSVPGHHAIRLEASDGVDIESADYTVYVVPTDIYVVSGDEHPGQVCTFPYWTWERATTNLADALAAADTGTTIHVSNGLFRVTAELAIEKGIAIEGVNGAASTTVCRIGGRRLSDTKHRIFNINHPQAVVSGLSIANGYLNDQQARGAGVRIGGLGGTLRNCIVSNNYMYANMYTYGAGIHMSAGLVDGCLVTVNTNATQVNDTTAYGGGICIAGGVVQNTSIIGNCLFENCNPPKPTSALAPGAGVAVSGQGVLLNCLVADNYSEAAAGGVAVVSGHAYLTNCTVVANRAVTAAPASGLSVSGGTLTAVNTAVFGNVSGTATNEVTATAQCMHCLASDGTFAAGNENGNLNGNASVFADFDAGDYTPVRAGTLHDAGIYDPSWMDGAADLAGNPRIDHYRRGIGLVDIGAYEAPYIPTATIMFIR